MYPYKLIIMDIESISRLFNDLELAKQIGFNSQSPFKIVNIYTHVVEFDCPVVLNTSSSII